MMTSLPACTPQVQRGTMPTLGNNNIRCNNKEQVKHIVYSDRGSSSSKLVQGTNSVKTNNVAIKPFVPTAKLTLDGKVVDIDVLTKLQQQNGGNIVSFTASKEFLSNLASAKINSAKNNTAPTSKPRVNKQEVSVFKSITGKKAQQDKVLLPKTQINGFTQNSQRPRIEVKKFAPEIKGLLSGLSTAFKSTSSISVNTTNCSRDVQSGSSFQGQNGPTLFQGTNIPSSFQGSNIPSSFQGSNVTVSYQGTNISASFQGSNVSASFQGSNVSCKGITEQAKRNLLLAVKTTEQITTSSLNTHITTPVGSKPNLVSHVTNNRQIQTPTVKKLPWNCLSQTSPQTSSVIVPNSARNIARTQSVITSTGTNKIFPFKTSYNQFDSQQTLKQSNQIIEEEKRKRSPTCNIKVKRDNYVYSTDFGNKNNSTDYVNNKNNIYESQFYPGKNVKDNVKTSHTYRNISNDVKNDSRLQIKQEAKTVNDAPKSKSSIANFTELYENAVRNVLNIKAFTDNFTSITNTTSYSKQIEKAFDAYLKRPVEFDIKLDRFKYTGSRSQESPSNNKVDGEPSNKRVRTEEKYTNTNHNDNNTQNNHQQSPEDSNNTTNNATPISSQDNNMEYFRLFDFKRQQQEDKKTNQYENQNKLSEVDNRSFFAQFLSDQTFLTQHQPHSYYSPADFPWLYPAYMYEKYYQAHLPYYYYGDYLSNENINEPVTSTNNQEHEGDNNTTEMIVEEKVEEEPPPPPTPPPPTPTPNEQNNFRMKLNPVPNEQTDIIKEEIKEEQDPVSSPSPQESKKKCKNKKDTEKMKTTPNENPVQRKKIKLKDSLKYRPYSLRQRVKALKKAKKIAHLSKPKPPKYILKDMNAKNLTKKEIFLGYLGLRRILKRNDKRVNEGK